MHLPSRSPIWHWGHSTVAAEIPCILCQSFNLHSSSDKIICQCVPMCCNVFQCVSSTLGCSAHWAHWNFSMCSAMCTSDNVFRNVLLADFAMRSKHIGLQCAFNVPQCVFNVFFCTLKHIETHCGDCCNNYIKISLIIMCFNVFQCAPNVHPMCSNMFSMCFMHIGILPQISMCRKHIENTFEHIEGTLNLLLIAPR